jgi:signal transduction histidine kinase
MTFSSLIVPLGRLEERASAARRFAQALGAEDALFFVKDAENAELLPAPGFQKTFPGRDQWRAFLRRVLYEGVSREEVSVKAGAIISALGIRISDDGVLILLGGAPDLEAVEEARPLLPLIEAVLQAEQAARIARAGEQMERGASAQLSGIASTLDSTRLQYQQTLREASNATKELQRELAERRKAEQELQKQRDVLDTVHRVNATLAAELHLETLVQVITDAGTELTGAQFGAFFYNVVNAEGEPFTLYTTSGVPPEAFLRPPSPSNTPVFQPTFGEEGVVRSDDITEDLRYGTMAPHFDMPKGHFPVRSYLAVPIISRRGDGIGGMFFGHADPAVFTLEAEQIVIGIADQAAIAVENARLFSTVRAAEADLRSLNESLEQRVALRTQQLQREVEERTRAEASLAEAVRELNQRNQILQDFAYVASHDLQEPLRKIQTFAGLLTASEEISLGEDEQYYLDRMQQAAKRMSRLIRDLLAFSRIEVRAQQFKVVDLDEMLAGVLGDLEVRLSETQGRVESGPLGSIEADPVQMQQVFQNLVGNALKFHQPNVPPVVRIQREDRNEQVVLTFEDNGVGFASRHAERIFAPFQRLHSTAEYEGTGMGLAIVHRIALRHGGMVTATGAPNVGSCFTVILPATQHRDPAHRAEGDP